MPITGSIEDREEVRVLHARYCLTIDTCRYDEWIDCFTEDGVFESPRFGKHAGRDGLRRFTAMYKESLGGAQVLHVVANPAFDLDGDNGTGTSYLSTTTARTAGCSNRRWGITLTACAKRRRDGSSRAAK